MSDAWTDRKNRTLINFSVNCLLGSMFVKNVDGSSYMKTGAKIFLAIGRICPDWRAKCRASGD